MNLKEDAEKFNSIMDALGLDSKHTPYISSIVLDLSSIAKTYLNSLMDVAKMSKVEAQGIVIAALTAQAMAYSIYREQVIKDPEGYLKAIEDGLDI